MRFALAAAAVFLASFPTLSFAAAGESECVWNTIPVAKRDDVIAAYANNRTYRVGDADLSPDYAAAILCSGPIEGSNLKARARRTGKIIGIYSVEVSAGEYLASRGYRLPVLDRAWSSLGAVDRSTLRSFSQRIDAGDSPEQASDLIDAGGAIALRLTDLSGRPKDLDPNADPALAVFIDYFLSRAIREAYEATD